MICHRGEVQESNVIHYNIQILYLWMKYSHERTSTSIYIDGIWLRFRLTISVPEKCCMQMGITLGSSQITKYREKLVKWESAQ